MTTLNIGVFRGGRDYGCLYEGARASVESRGQTIVWESGPIPNLNLGTCDSPEWVLHFNGTEQGFWRLRTAS
jgi:hypothetical protein